MPPVEVFGGLRMVSRSPTFGGGGSDLRRPRRGAGGTGGFLGAGDATREGAREAARTESPVRCRGNSETCWGLWLGDGDTSRDEATERAAAVKAVDLSPVLCRERCPIDRRLRGGGSAGEEEKLDRDFVGVDNPSNFGDIDERAVSYFECPVVPKLIDKRSESSSRSETLPLGVIMVVFKPVCALLGGGGLGGSILV